MVLQRLLDGLGVLVVDDTEDALGAVCALLTLHGADARGADSAHGALRLLEGGFRPDVLLLDLNLPVVDGYELLRRIRSGPAPSAPAIAFTGLSGLEDRERAFAAGFQRFLSKPLDTQRLVDAVAVLARTAAAAQPAPRWNEGLASLAGLRVVLVDDDKDTLDVVATLLRGLGAAVTTFASVSTALEGMGSARPHVVLTDVAMPEADGVELLRRIRALPHAAGDVPVIALTAYGEDYEAAGFDAILAKPPRPEQLARVVHAAVRPVDLVLYVGDGPSEVAGNLKAVLERFDSASVRYTVVDVREAAERARADAVTATPLLVRHHPNPRATLSGDLHDLDAAAAVLEGWGAAARRH